MFSLEPVVMSAFLCGGKTLMWPEILFFRINLNKLNGTKINVLIWNMKQKETISAQELLHFAF